MEPKYHLTKLKNGIRIASVEMPYMKSVSVGFWVGVGGRHESSRTNGIAHFVEHLLFKGTKRRNARKIIESVEGIGGYLNAFTTEDHTCYYAKAAAKHLPEICDVLADMYLESQLPPDEIERERGVIREEILMSRDHPAQHVQEVLSETMWPEHPLGRPLTGSLKTIAAFNRPQLMNFIGDHYNGKTTIITVAGRVNHDEVVRILKPMLERLPGGKTPRYERCRVKPSKSRISLVTQDTEQTHLTMGFYTFGRSDERRYALKLLSVLLGENMSSRLFQKLREKHGFCYSVSTGTAMFSDAGLINISAGLDTSNLEKAVRMIMKELAALCKKKPGKQELRQAQDYTVGQTLMGLESTTNQIMWMGESLLGYGKILNPAEIEERIMAVTAEEIQRVACACLNPDRLGVAIVGPLKESDKIKSWLSV